MKPLHTLASYYFYPLPSFPTLQMNSLVIGMIPHGKDNVIV